LSQKLKSWWQKNWPWLIALFWLGGYELYALWSQEAITLSRIVWQAPSYLVWLVIPPCVILLIHFFHPKYNRVRKKK
jgi:hypothetical protein